jgi:serine O-acetyltransferase
MSTNPSINLWFNWFAMANQRDFYTCLVYGRESKFLGKLSYYALKLLGIEIPRPVVIGDNFELAHGGFGVVIHPNSKIGDRVKIYPGVTLGRADVYREISRSKFEGIVIDDDVVLASGAKILCKEGTLRVRQGTVIGANSVLLEPTGENEIWVGIPAKCIGKRDPLIQTGDRQQE